MYKIEYAALKYYNSIISEECLYVGMLFHNLDTGECTFRHISNFGRFQSFDDEADVSFVKLYLRGIKEYVENSLFNNNSFNLMQFTKKYVNEFRFTEVHNLVVNEDEDYIDNLTKMFLKFDFSKSNRLSNRTEKQYIKRILSSKNVEFSNPQICGDYEENIKFDYVINNMAIKYFDFKEKDLKRLINTAKQWAFTAYELSDSMDVIYMYDDTVEVDKNLLIIKNILNQHANLFNIQEGIEYILKQQS